NTTADGALYFTVRDLTRWAIALNHRRVPSPAALDTAWTPVRLNDGATYPYGFGWGVFNQRGALRISHGGSWQGFKTVIARYPESRSEERRVGKECRSRGVTKQKTAYEIET